jgi:hypothetical protein
MALKLNFTITIPPQYTGSLTSPANSSQIISSQPVSNSIDLHGQTSQGVTSSLSQIWNGIADFFNKIWECLCHKKKGKTLSTEEIERRRITQERELAVWQRQMGINLRPTNVGGVPFVDLSGKIVRPGICPAVHMERIPQIGHYSENYPILNPLLAAKLPARQLQRFPEAIKNELANIDPDNLDLYFVVWRDIPRMFESGGQSGKRNLIYHPVAFPNAQRGETHYRDMSMGIFETEGIEQAHGEQHLALPFNRFGLQNVHIHPQDAQGEVMCISPDHSRFHLPADRRWSTFHSACKFSDNRAAAVFGIILNSEERSQEFDMLCQRGHNPITLQEYKTGIQTSRLDPSLKRKIAHMLEFHT